MLRQNVCSNLCEHAPQRGCVLCTLSTDGHEIPALKRGQALYHPLTTDGWFTPADSLGKAEVHRDELLPVCLKQVLDLAEQGLQHRASELVHE
jgi:hypothetical protein